jgi:hypothetical protein
MPLLTKRTAKSRGLGGIEIQISHKMPSSSRFPTYLLPSVSFHRLKVDRQSSDCEIPRVCAEVAERESPATYLHGHSSHLQCARCTTDLCYTSQIISKGFTGRHGRAYLVSPTSPFGTFSQSSKASKSLSLPNTHVHKTVSRQLVTGAHTVSDVSCAFCGSVLGWKYDGADEESQRYKVGNFILETKKIYSSSCWEHHGWDELGQSGLYPRGTGKEPRDRERDDRIEFDSQDEDECEDLFAGLWSPSLANRRRKGRKFERVVAEMAHDAISG